MDKHKYNLIYIWKKRGVISEDYNKLYENHMSINNCKLCNIEFDKNIRSQWRTLDHDHNTGFYRQTICYKCNIQFDRKESKMYKNNKIGFKNISFYSNSFRYEKMIKNKRVRKYFKTLKEALVYKFIQELKNKIKK